MIEKDTKVPISPVIGGEIKKPKAKTSEKKYYALILLVLLIVVLLGVVLLINHHKKTTIVTKAATVNSKVCSYSTIQSAVNSFSADKTAQLKVISDSIKNQSNYQHDPNCMYIITVDNINAYNVGDAQASLAQLKSDINGNNLSQNLTFHLSVAMLTEAVNAMNQKASQNVNNIKALSPKPMEVKN